MQNILIYYVGSGLCFYLGLVLIVIAFLVSISNHWIHKTQSFLMVLGLFIIAISATPFPWWLYIALLVAITSWQTYLLCKAPQQIGRLRLPQKRLLSFAIVTILVVIGLFEWPYHQLPKLKKPNSILILADSITAGTGVGDKTLKWPAQLSQKLQADIDDRSLPGARCSTALNQLRKSPVVSGMVILEIGGNDLLGSTSEQKFDSDLRALLLELNKLDLDIVMFELPLPPLRNRYGQIQRSLANEFDVTLVPKWFLLKITCHPENTIDSIHLTQRGHDQFANNVASLFE